MVARAQFPKRWQCSELRLPDGTVIGSGVLTLTARGRIDLEVTFPSPRSGLGDDEDLEQDISGTTDDGQELRATMCAPTSTTGFKTKLVVGAAVIERPSHAPRWTRKVLHLRGARCIGPTQFDDGAFSIRLADRSGPDDDTRGNIRASLEMTARAPVEQWDDDAGHDYLQLLSVAQRVQVWAALEEFYDRDSLVRTVLTNTAGGWECTNPLVPWWPKPLASFFLQTLPRYRAERSRYELDSLIWHFCRSYVEDVVDMKFISASVFMEAFKFHWAKNVAGLTADLKANGLVRGFVKSTTAKGKPVLFTFEELFTQACAHLGFVADVEFIEDRNALFHTGAPGSAQRGQRNSWVALRSDLIRLYAQMDEILLRILGYHGPFDAWDKPDETMEFPTRIVLQNYDPLV